MLSTDHLEARLQGKRDSFQTFACALVEIQNHESHILRLAARGQINVSQPITRRYTLAEADQAYQARNRGEIVGRAIVVME